MKNPMRYRKKVGIEHGETTVKGAQVCTICTSVNREQIEAAVAARVPYRDIAAKFQTSPSALSRHKAHTAPSSEPAETPKQFLDAVDAGIAELRVLMRRGRKHKNKIVGTELALKASRELRAWILLRSQLARRVPAVPIEETEALDQDTLNSMAQALLDRQKGKPN